MPAFNYIALDAEGNKKKGVVESDSPRQARQQIRDRGFIPVSVATIAQGKSIPGGIFFGQSLGASQLALVTRQLATLVRSGFPLEEVLETVSRQSTRANIKSMLSAIRSRVMEGLSLAQSLAAFPRSFPEMYRATISAGEQTGKLDTILERLADYTEARQLLRQKTMQALIYPILLTTTAILVTGFLLTYVVPQVVQVFEHTGDTLPTLTVALIGVSQFLQNYGLFLLILIAAAVVATPFAMRNINVRRQYHHILLRIPVLSRLVTGLNTARFARTLSILTSSGVAILDSLHISAQVITNLPMREAVENASIKVREGASLHKSLENTGLFPPMTVQLIASGETGGNIDTMLERAAIQQEREVEGYIAVLMGVFEPALILLMGLIVLTIVLATLLPIFELNQLIK